jgi:hypothetical protein
MAEKWEKALVAIGVVTLIAIIAGYNVAQFYPPKPVTTTTILTTTGLTTLLTTGQIYNETATTNVGLTMSVQSSGAWYFLSGVGEAAVIPRNQSVRFDLQLNNTGESAIEIRGIQVSFVYPNGSVPAAFAPIYGQALLSRGQLLVVPFQYGTNLPRFPGLCCGKLIFVVFGDWGVVTKPVPLWFE